jgi:hypothetical protein
LSCKIQASFFIFHLIGLDIALVGKADASFAAQSMASLEFYLYALSKTEIKAAMNRSQSLAIDPNCKFG